jgi:hypothetical protein
MIKFDLNMAQSFLDKLDPEGVFTFQIFDDSMPSGRTCRKAILHE